MNSQNVFQGQAGVIVYCLLDFSFNIERQNLDYLA